MPKYCATETGACSLIIVWRTRNKQVALKIVRLAFQKDSALLLTVETFDVRVFVPHGTRDGRAQLLDIPHDETGSRVESRQRAQRAWQDGQPIFTAVHQPTRQ
jgi:hypothetical protein